MQTPTLAMGAAAAAVPQQQDTQVFGGTRSAWRESHDPDGLGDAAALPRMEALPASDATPFPHQPARARADGRGKHFAISRFRRNPDPRVSMDADTSFVPSYPPTPTAATSPRAAAQRIPRPPVSLNTSALQQRRGSAASDRKEARSPSLNRSARSPKGEDGRSARVRGFQFSDKAVRQKLVHEALVSVGEIVVKEQLELAKQEGYENFGQVLFGAKKQKQGKRGGQRLLRRTRGDTMRPATNVQRERSGSRMSAASSAGRSSAGSAGDGRRALFIDGVQLQSTIEKASLASISRKHLRNTKHPLHEKAATVLNTLVSSVELQDCVHDSVEFALMALSANVPLEVLSMPLPDAIKIDYMARKAQAERERFRANAKLQRSPKQKTRGESDDGTDDVPSSPKSLATPPASESRADRLLREEQLRREQVMNVGTHPKQVVCERHGLWYTLLQPDAPAPPLHMRVPSRYRSAVSAEVRGSMLPVEHYFDMRQCNRQATVESRIEASKSGTTAAREAVPAVTDNSPSAASGSEPRGAMRTSNNTGSAGMPASLGASTATTSRQPTGGGGGRGRRGHAPSSSSTASKKQELVGDEKLDSKLMSLSEAYLVFLWSIDSVPFRDEVVACVPHVVALSVREIIEERRSRAIAAELAQKQAAARHKRDARMGLVHDESMALALEQSADLGRRMSTVPSSTGLLGGGDGPLLVTDEDREQYRLQRMGRDQKLFDEAIATVHRDLVWLFSGIDRRVNYAEAAWVTSGAAHSFDDELTLGTETNTVALRQTAMSSAVKDTPNMHDLRRPAPLFPWQLCSDGTTSNKQFRERMKKKVDRAEHASRVRASEGVTSGTTRPSAAVAKATAASAFPDATFMVSMADNDALPRAGHLSMSESSPLVGGVHSPRGGTTATPRRARGVFAGVETGLHLRQVKQDLAAIRHLDGPSVASPSSPSAVEAKAEAEAQSTSDAQKSSAASGSAESASEQPKPQRTRSVTARLLGDNAAATVDRLRAAVGNTLPRARGAAVIGLPHAQKVVAEAQRTEQNRCEWYEQGRRFGPSAVHADAPHGFFDLSTVSPLVSLQVRPSTHHRSRATSGAQTARANAEHDAAKPPRRSNLPHSQAHMRWLL